MYLLFMEKGTYREQVPEATDNVITWPRLYSPPPLSPCGGSSLLEPQGEPTPVQVECPGLCSEIRREGSTPSVSAAPTPTAPAWTGTAG